MKKRTFRTTAIFKCILKMKNGSHKIVRLTIEKVAEMTLAVRNFKSYGLVSTRHMEFLTSLDIPCYDIVSCRFINERTGEELLSL